MLSGEELIPRLNELYRLIDEAYGAVAAQVRFSCEGCDGGTCCTVDLTIHTFVEKLYLRWGFNTLDVSAQLEILGRCRAIVKAREDDPSGDLYRNAVCALNVDGLCSLYEYRPLICRLAGIRHVFVKPDASTVESAGCPRFEKEIAPTHPDLKLDRTGFYRRMAEIEIAVVRSIGRRTSPRTVAEVLGLEEPEDCFP